MMVERLREGWGSWGSGYGTLLTRSQFVEMAGLRPLSDDEETETSHYAIRTLASPHHSVSDDDGDVIVSSIHLACWAIYRGDEVMVTRHELGGRMTSETFVCG